MSDAVALLPHEELRDAVGSVPGVQLLVPGEEVGREPEVEVLVAPYARSTDAVRRVPDLPGLRLVQLQSAGYDGVPALLPAGVRLANARGVHDDATAEMAVALALATLREIPLAVRQHGRWSRPDHRRSLADSRVLVLGYGSIGRAVTVRLHAMQAEVTAVASTRREDPLVGTVHGTDELDGLLADTDVVICLTPHTERTQHLVDDAFLSRLRDGALVVNVARGPVLDTDAVLAHAGRLRFALDVTDPEPLPEGHPLWQAPDVLITPHTAGGTTAMPPRIAALVRRQLTAYAAGEELLNLVG